MLTSYWLIVTCPVFWLDDCYKTRPRYFLNCSDTYGYSAQRCYYKMTRHIKEIRIYCKNIYFTKDWMECLSRNELNNQALSLLEALQFSFRLCIKFSIESTMITLNESLSIGHCSQHGLILYFAQKLPSHIELSLLSNMTRPGSRGDTRTPGWSTWLPADWLQRWRAGDTELKG